MVGPKPIRPVSAKNNLGSNLEKSSNKKKPKSSVEKKASLKADTKDATDDSGKENKPVIPLKEENIDVSTTDLKKLEQSQIEECVGAFFKLVELEKSEKKSLFSSEGEKVKLQISGIKLPRDCERQVLKCRLPHSPMASSGDVCLIVKDLEKGLKVDHEDTVRHFTDLLQEKGVKGITQVIALRELKVEYKQYEAKTQLCHRFDKFLADDRIIRLLPKFLGKPFYKRKKLPVQVNLKSKDLPSEISRAVDTVTLPLTNTGSCSAVTVGNSTMGQTELVSNVASIIKMIEERYPGGWTNVRSVHLLSGSNSLPLYISLRATQEVGKVTGAKLTGRSVVIDELSTVPGATVIVTPGGVVRVKRKKDPEWDDDDEIEKNIKGDKEDEENNSKKKPEKETNDGVKKQKTSTPVDEESDDEMEDKEMEYMRKVAEEEEEMENKIDANDEQQADKLKENTKDASDSEEDDVIDDDAEAENLLSDGDDSESDDDLVMKAAPLKDVEDEEEDEKPAKKKKKKDKGKTDKRKVEKKTATPSKKSLKQKKFTEKKKKEKMKSKK